MTPRLRVLLSEGTSLSASAVDAYAATPAVIDFVRRATPADQVSARSSSFTPSSA
jgi:hypothetical protein